MSEKILTLDGEILINDNKIVTADVSGGGGGSPNIQSSKSYTVSGSGSTTISPDTGYDGMAAVALTTPAGTATTPTTSITANPNLSIDFGTGEITATISKTQNVTPTVSAGYVSSGTAGTITITGSNTDSIATQAAQTIYPSTSDQTISSQRLLTGKQTIKGVLLTNLSAGNIKKDVIVKVGDSVDDDRITSITGTYEASGSSVTLTPYTIRPDAELVKSYSDDFLVITDKGVTKPSYTTTSTTLIAGGTALSSTVSLSNTNYRYYIVMRYLTIPQYSVTTKAAARQEYTAMSAMYEVVNYDANTFSALVSSTKYASRNATIIAVGNGFVRCVYWSSASAIKLYTANSYGCAQTINTAPAISSGTSDSPTITFYTPNVVIRGSSTYLNSTYWGYITDIRCQYIYEVYRVPKTTTSTYGIDGWAQYNNMLQLINCAQSTTHNLT